PRMNATTISNRSLARRATGAIRLFLICVFARLRSSTATPSAYLDHYRTTRASMLRIRTRHRTQPGIRACTCSGGSRKRRRSDGAGALRFSKVAANGFNSLFLNGGEAIWRIGISRPLPATLHFAVVGIQSPRVAILIYGKSIADLCLRRFGLCRLGSRIGAATNDDQYDRNQEHFHKR